MSKTYEVGAWLRRGLPKADSVVSECDVILHRVGNLKAQATAVGSVIRQASSDKSIAIVLKDESGDFGTLIDALRAVGINVAVEVPTASRTNPVRLELQLLVGAAVGDTERTIRVFERFRQTVVDTQQLIQDVRQADSLVTGLETYWTTANVLERLLGEADSSVFVESTGTPEQQAAIEHYARALSVASFMDNDDLFEGAWEEFDNQLDALGDDDWGQRYQLDGVQNDGVTLTSIMQLDRDYDVICVMDVSMDSFDDSPEPTKLFPPGSPGWQAHPTMTAPTKAAIRETFGHAPQRSNLRSQYWLALHARQLGTAIDRATAEVHLFAPDDESDAMPSTLVSAIEDALPVTTAVHNDIATAREIRETIEEGDYDVSELRALCIELRNSVETAPSEIKDNVRQELTEALATLSRESVIEQQPSEDNSHE
ncbi:hypothetical protein [Haloprofundus salinisoli]|uniref:hypothetical protein n=1 Tax=Haloprofundus salinisoli TaxID=2876193 RepID=UPI001CCF3D73|nr:hypothetical protein [Haloprofundus salinisoli]